MPAVHLLVLSLTARATVPRVCTVRGLRRTWHKGAIGAYAYVVGEILSGLDLSMTAATLLDGVLFVTFFLAVLCFLTCDQASAKVACTSDTKDAWLVVCTMYMLTALSPLGVSATPRHVGQQGSTGSPDRSWWSRICSAGECYSLGMNCPNVTV